MFELGEDMHATTTGRSGAFRITLGWVAPIILLAACVLLYSINLGRLGHPDEYYHILAAKGLLATGEPRIAEGLYTRVYLHTWLVSQSFALFGESLAAARVPSLVAVTALVILMFVWLRGQAGTLAAWIGAGLFAVSPFAVEVAQFCRFYALQSLAMFVTGIAVHASVCTLSSRPFRGFLLSAFSLASLTLAVYLQATSLFGCAGLALWTAGAVGLPWLTDHSVTMWRKLLVVTGLVLAGVLALAAAFTTGLAGELWQQYSRIPYFSQRYSDQFWFYHNWYNLLYPSLWPITGFLALFAVAVAPGPASMAVLVFVVGFLLNSFAAAKSLRYIAYAQPFLFAIWGIALAALWPRLVAFAKELHKMLAQKIGLFGAPYQIATTVVAAAILFLGVANTAVVRSVTILAEITIPPEQPRINWIAARAELEPWLEHADVVVSTEELGHIYYLGRYDVRFGPSKIEELPPSEQHDFGLDHRTGRPVIGTPASLKLILKCYPSGIIVGPAAHWGRPEAINNDLAAFIATHARPLVLPRESQLSAWVWKRAPPPHDDRCLSLPAFRSRANASR